MKFYRIHLFLHLLLFKMVIYNFMLHCSNCSTRVSYSADPRLIFCCYSFYSQVVCFLFLKSVALNFFSSMNSPYIKFLFCSFTTVSCSYFFISKFLFELSFLITFFHPLANERSISLILVLGANLKYCIYEIYITIENAEVFNSLI